MKKLILIILSSLLIAACGHNDDSTSDHPDWAQHDQNTLLLGCTTTADATIPSGTTGSNLAAANTIIGIYCHCMLKETMKRFSAAQVNADNSIVAPLLTDGTSSTCTQMAQQ